MVFEDSVVVCGSTLEDVEQRLKVWRGVMENQGIKCSRKNADYLKLMTNERRGR